jgi:hypothetical protein
MRTFMVPVHVPSHSVSVFVVVPVVVVSVVVVSVVDSVRSPVSKVLSSSGSGGICRHPMNATVENSTLRYRWGIEDLSAFTKMTQLL